MKDFTGLFSSLVFSLVGSVPSVLSGFANISAVKEKARNI